MDQFFARALAANLRIGGGTLLLQVMRANELGMPIVLPHRKARVVTRKNCHEEENWLKL